MAPVSESYARLPNPTQTKTNRDKFFRCCLVGNIDQVRSMLRYGFDPNVTDEFGNTPLLKATKFGHLEIVELLIAYDADITVINYAGWSALKYSRYYHRPQIESLLRNHGAIE